MNTLLCLLTQKPLLEALFLWASWVYGKGTKKENIFLKNIG